MADTPDLNDLIDLGRICCDQTDFSLWFRF